MPGWIKVIIADTKRTAIRIFLCKPGIHAWDSSGKYPITVRGVKYKFKVCHGCGISSIKKWDTQGESSGDKQDIPR